VARRPEPDLEPGEAGRSRPVYIGACRIDIVRRGGTAAIASDARLARTVARALEAADAPTPASVTVVLTDDDELTELNRTHLERDEPTDVLSFPMLPPEAFPPHEGRPRPSATGARERGGTRVTVGSARVHGGRVHVGDIAISVERAIGQAEAGRGGQTGDVRWSPVDELRLLVTHGVLHLCGWDHAEPPEEAAMRALEQRLLAEDRR